MADGTTGDRVFVVLVSALDRLVEADLVSRAEDLSDRRRVLVKRTRAGTTFVRDLVQVADQVAGELGRLS